ncbi:MAG: hypothetical protein ABI693_14360 [Bryobacteraceae bacterium]
MLQTFILPETIVREDGTGQQFDVGSSHGKTFVFTLGITRIIEQESLELSIWGSADGSDWGTIPLFSFPQKFYCGTYTMLLDLSRTPDVRTVRVQWKVNRWGRGEPKPLFAIYVFTQESEELTLAAAGA